MPDSCRKNVGVEQGHQDSVGANEGSHLGVERAEFLEEDKNSVGIAGVHTVVGEPRLGSLGRLHGPPTVKRESEGCVEVTEPEYARGLEDVGYSGKH